jgi:hypothetical protein
MHNNKKCKNCKKKFYSSTGKENCRKCSVELGLVKPQSLQRAVQHKLRKVCADVNDYAHDIKMLSIKNKWGLMTPVDYFRVCSIYMDVVCNDRIYSTREIDAQVNLMLLDLNNLLKYKNEKKERKPYQSRAIVQLDKSGKVIRTFASVRDAVRQLDYCDITIKKACNGHKTFVKEILKWKTDVNI